MMSNESIFQTIRPLCVRVTKEPTAKNVNSLQSFLKTLQENDINTLQEYIIFPLQFVLKQKTILNNELMSAVFECLLLVLKSVTVSNFAMFQDVFNSCCIVLNHPSQLYKPNEELKLTIVQCLNQLFLKCDHSVSAQIYNANMLPILGHCVSSMLAIAKNEELGELRRSAINFIRQLSYREKRKIDDTKVPNIQVADILAAFLPGITVGLSNIMIGDVKQSHGIVVAALNCFSDVIVSVLGDKTFESPKDSGGACKGLFEKKDERNLMVKRTDEWVIGTSEKLKILVQKIKPLSSHSNFKVRLALVKWADSILTNCQRSLKNCLPLTLEIVISVVGDEYPQVARQSRAVLTKYRSLDLEGCLDDLLLENLYNLTTTLPRIIVTKDDLEKLSTLNLLFGYLQILGSKVNAVLYSSSHLEKLTISLNQLLEMKPYDLRVYADFDSTNLSLSETLNIQKVGMRFKHFSDEKIYDITIKILKGLGHYGDADVIIDRYTDLMNESSLYRCQSILSLNAICIGIYEKDSKVDLTTSRLMSSLVKLFLSQKLWDIPTELGNDLVLSGTSSVSSDLLLINDARLPWQQESDKQNLRKIQTNTQQLCLLMLGLGTMSKVLGEEFKLLLMDVLYPLLEKLGDEKPILRQAAFQSLSVIAESCKYSSVNELICQNCDYITNSISIRLRHLSANPKAPVVLKAMLEHCDKDLVPYIRDILQEILDSLDENYDTETTLFMPVLLSTVSATKRWYPNKCKDQQSTEEAKDDCDIVNYIIGYHENYIISTGHIDVEDDVDDNECPVDENADEDDLDDKKPEVPDHVKLVSEVLERCIHLLSCNHPKLRLTALNTVMAGCETLLEYQDTLLPLVHRLWPGIVERFQDKEHVVIRKAFDTLCILGETCGDFLNRRVRKEVIPNLTSFLNSQGQISIKAGPAYKFTTAFKLQRTILENIGNLCVQLNITEQYLDSVTNALMTYLSSRQPQILQKAAISAILKLSAIDRDLTWLSLTDLWYKQNLEPKCNGFPNIYFKNASKRTEFTDNVSFILNSLETPG